MATPEERPFPTRVAEEQTPRCRVTTRHLEGSLIESRFEGHVSASLLRSVLDDAPMLFLRLPHIDWLVDLTEAVGFDPGLRVPGADLFAEFRRHGGRRIAFVTRSGMLRMMISTVAFATRVPARLYETRERAIEELQRPNDASAWR